MAHKENYNPNEYPPVIEKRTAVGSIHERGRKPHLMAMARSVKNIPMVAVLCNGVTVAQFASESEADLYIAQRWPNRKRHAFDNWTKES